MPRKNKRTRLENKLDELWRKGGVSYCEICNTLPLVMRINYTQIHAHHIVGRRNKVLRWDVRNRLKVCSYHHTFGKADETVQDNLGGWFLNWSSNDDWMGKYKPEDKEYLRGRHKITYKQYTIEELENYVKLLENSI